MKPKNQTGNVLLIALLILSGSVVTGLTVGTIVISEIRQSRNLDNSIVAFYGAESGMEQALYYYNKDRAEFDDWLTTSNHNYKCNFYSENFIPDDCEYYAHHFSGPYNFFLPKGQVKEIALYQDDLSDGSQVGALDINWEDKLVGNGLEPWLEIEAVQFDTSWESGFRETKNIVKSCHILSGGTYSTGDPSDNTQPACGLWNTITDEDYDIFYSDKNYIVRFRSLYDDVKVSVNRAGGSNQWLPRRMSIQSTGNFGNTEQIIQAEVTDKLTAQSLSDYVIFTDCEIAKGIGEGSNCP